MQINNRHLIWRYLGLGLLALLILGPFILGVWTSLLPTAEIAKGALIGGPVSLANYGAAVHQTAILRYLLNSLVIATLTTIAQVLLCSLGAYAFVFLTFKGREALFYVILATMMLPFEAEVIPNFATARQFNLLNHYAILVLPFLTSAFGIFMLRQAFRQIPGELKEAADIEGLNPWQFYWHVVLPYARISLVTLAAYSFLGSWNQYLWPMLTTFSDRFRPVQDGLRQLQSQETFNNWGMIQASAVIVVLPTLIVLFVGQHFFKTGLNQGATKS
ncbi:sugar ABC superfamily ATP binding cassette transporter, membrane protein [Levilactobacillus acidifarinae DSM 19394]|uniref:Sugar ABC superfamily ATP binding cassette transporter, membrane protein n=2 Tax=Levilactobacillus acidifarinae TaxID=267364 RepID=A0A0R1LQX5_9LACO|nr:sugar ABC superfamily ATP binding cassette transporter, membrane protein [Levilactobacillus acidifarinae DSM 19394]